MSHPRSAPCLCVRRYVDARDSGGRSALHYAALYGLQALLRWLLQHDADVNLQDGQGQTPLHLALKDRHREAASLLLSSPLQRVSLTDQFDRLPLHWAAQAGYDDLLPLCLTGVAVDSRTQGGDTALHWAVAERRLGCVRVLISRGASATAVNARDESVEQLARGAGPELERLVKARQEAELREVEERRQMEGTAGSSADGASTAFAIPVQTVAAAAAPGVKKKMTIRLRAGK